MKLDNNFKCNRVIVQSIVYNYNIVLIVFEFMFKVFMTVQFFSFKMLSCKVTTVGILLRSSPLSKHIMHLCKLFMLN
jgi:hypothetical protein